LLLSLFLGIGYSLAGLLEPWSLKIVIDNVLLNKKLSHFLAFFFPAGGDHRLPLLYAMMALIVLLAVARGFLYYYQKLLAARVGNEVGADIRLDLYSHLHHLSFNFHDRRRTGDMLTRLTSDIKLLRDIFISLPLTMTSDLLLVMGMIGVMFYMDWSLTLMALAILPSLGIMLRIYQGPLKAAARRQRDREGDVATIASEVLGAIKVVQGFQRERYEIDRFTVENKRSLRTGMKAARLEAKLHWYTEVAVAGVTALVVGVAAKRVMAGLFSLGDLTVFLRYLSTFTKPLRRVSNMAERSTRGAVAGERVLEMMEIEPMVRDLPGAIAAPRFEGEILFEGVSFSHLKSAAVLTDIHLEIRRGERMAIVGPTGSGKTSLVSLIPRFYDPTEGRVSIDGRDLREFTLASLRKRISLVFQEPILFATTIAENIGYGKPGATREEIIAAAEQAGIHPIIQALPEGYETVIGERGGTLSGGQRQCVAIARAMIKDAPIVILDEPSTGLDSRSSHLVGEALRRLMEGKTVILISHHLLSVEDVDRIIVIEGGRIVEEGTHDALLSRGGLYQLLQRFQSREELLP
jgi:ABC-type multidrug transport system fused ATPase/permease subunit